MSINTLKDIFIEKGKQTLDLLLRSEKITVYEKLDGLNFGFVYTREQGLKFFKRDPNSNIGEVDRTLTSMYEDAIQYIKKLPQEVFTDIEGYTFGFYYFPAKNTSMLSYDEIPLNNLILSYVDDEDGDKVLSKDVLDAFAERLNVGKVPIIFEGKLNQEQIGDIFKFLELSKEERREKYKNLSFAEHLYTIIKPDAKKTVLNNNLKGQIESLIFRFDNENGESTYSKIVNPYFEDVMQANKENNNGLNMYELLLSDIMDFLLSVDLKKIKVTKKTFEERYVELICKLFNKLIRQKGKDYEEIVIELPPHLEKNFNNVNYDKIPNDETKEYVLASLNFKEIFRIFLASFRKQRRRQSSIFTKGMNTIFNSIVDELLEKCVLDLSVQDVEDIMGLEESLVSESFITFDDFERIYRKGEDSRDVVGLDLDTYLRKVPDYIVDFIESDFDVNKFTSSILTKTTPKPIQRDKRMKVNLLIDTFDPMTELVYEFAKFSYEKTKTPLILVCVGPRRQHYSDPLLEKAFKSLLTEEEFENYMLINRPNIKKVVYNFERDYRVDKIFSNEKWMEYIEMQIVSNFRDNNHLGLYDDEEAVTEYYHNDKSIIIRSDDAIAKSEFMRYKQYVPQAYSNLFNEIYSNYTFYNGK